MAPRLLLCLLLACAALPAAARQAALMDANGASGCPTVADADADAEPATRAVDKRAVAPKRSTRPAAARSGGDADAASRPPRWHSFLPGMIR